MGSPDSSDMMTGHSSSVAISSRRRQLRTCAWRSCSSGDDQSKTGTSEQIRTPVSVMAFLTSATAASSALG